MNVKKSVVRVVRSDMFVPVAGLVGAYIGGIATVAAVRAVDKAVWGAIPRPLQFAAGYGGATIGKEVAIAIATITQNAAGTGWGDLMDELRRAEAGAGLQPQPS